tara:strand:+ start:434 stop:700 length:267 start_codon:yes stop_codon:yes gene_type:complete
MMQRLNPNANAAMALEAKNQEARKVARAAAIKHSRSKAGQAEKIVRKNRFNALNSGLNVAFADAQAIIDAEVKAGQIDESEEEEESDE